MRGIRVWARLVGLRRAVIEDVWIGDEGEVVVAASDRSGGERQGARRAPLPVPPTSANGRDMVGDL